jgi:hypothetical protein
MDGIGRTSEPTAREAHRPAALPSLSRTVELLGSVVALVAFATGAWWLATGAWGWFTASFRPFSRVESMVFWFGCTTLWMLYKIAKAVGADV